MKRLLISIAVIVLSLGLGLILPLPADPGPQALLASQPRAGIPRPTASVPPTGTEAPQTTSLPAEPTEEQEEQKHLAKLEKGYVVLTDAEDRSSIIETITDLETPATVAALGRLLAIETDPELKQELIEAVGWGETTDTAKATVYAVALPAEQPASVRLAAIDGLSDLDANVALPFLRPFIADPDQEVRDTVLETIRNLENP